MKFFFVFFDWFFDRQSKIYNYTLIVVFNPFRKNFKLEDGKIYIYIFKNLT